MDRVQSMFSSNPFGTPAGELVEKATSSSLSAEDWSMNMQVCDAINSYSEGAKDAVKAIRKRLSSNKNYLQVTLTLSLLEGCVKNCGSQFHVLITTKEFCYDTLLKVIQPKYNPSVILQQKVLGMIKQWAEAFGSNPMMNGVKLCYDELVEKGYEFPQIASLKGIVDSNPKPRSNPRSHNHGMPRSQRPAQAVNQSQVSNLNPEQLAKLQKDLSIVNGNAKVFSEMLTELNPLQCDSSEYELMKELNRTCRAMQQRIVELIGQVGNEEITVELLRVNDDLNNIFLRYDRFEKFRDNKSTVKKSPETSPSVMPEPSSSMNISEPPPSYSDTIKPTPEVNDLIDLSAENPALKDPIVQPTNVNSLSHEFGDINLNNRNATSATPASYPFLSEQLSMFDKPPEQPAELAQLGSSEREIEQWLASDGKALGLNPAEPTSRDHAVTDEFSAFLSERAAASESLPKLPTSQGS